MAKTLLLPVIPAYCRSGRKRHDRPVTPEVAGSSPVAPVKTCKSASFVVRIGVNDNRLHSSRADPAREATGDCRETADGGGNRRKPESRSNRPEVFRKADAVQGSPPRSRPGRRLVRRAGRSRVAPPASPRGRARSAHPHRQGAVGGCGAGVRLADSEWRRFDSVCRHSAQTGENTAQTSDIVIMTNT